MATQVPNRRLLRDANLVKTKALPTAAANNNTATFDLQIGPWHPEEIEFEVAIPALAAQTDSTKNVVIKLYDSADDSSYAAVSPAVTITVPGVASTGSLALVSTIKLPIGVRRYVQFNQAVDTGGGAVTASSVTYSLLV